MAVTVKGPLHWLLPICLLIAPPIAADELEAVELRHRGVAGVWMPALMAQQIFRDLEDYDHALKELTLLKQKLVLLDTKLEISDQRIGDLNLALDTSLQIERKLEDSLSISEKYREQAEVDLVKAINSKNDWYRHPVLWVGVGVVLAVVAGVVVVKVAD